MIDYILPCIYAFLASLSFCVILSVKDYKIALIASLGGTLGWMAYLVSADFANIVVQNLIAAVTAALFAEFISRKLKTPATVFLIVGILPLVPGGGIYYTMEYLIQGNNEMFIAKGLETLAIAGAIAVGVSIASAIYRFYAYTVNQFTKNNK